ncbi:MAG: hypothetical protein AAFU85_15135 [Planctomycetota bacterium]
MRLVKSLPQRTLTMGFLVASLCLCGCGPKLGTGYGKSKGYLARRSVNGFSALREAYVKSGFKHRDLTRLTSRVRNANVIVWTPTHPSAIQVKTTRWFESWLTSGHKTLVYVLPDSGSEADYYREASGTAIPVQRLEYRRKYAESLNRAHRWELNRYQYPSNGWFDASPKLQSSPLLVDENATNAWRVPNDSPGEAVPLAEQEVRSEWTLHPYKSVDNSGNNANNVPVTITQPTGPGSVIPSLNTSTTPSRTEVDFASLVETEGGDTVVAKVTSKRWKNSQILVVASGSMLTNYGLTAAANRRLASRLIDASFEPMVVGGIVDAELRLLADGSEPQAAFASAEGQFPISEKVDGIPRATGAELLTVYPISLVTMHMAVIGMVICLMLLPTFGRPRTISRRALTHFGDHLDAVGTLMRRRGGASFARQRISEYMKRVRGETSGNWVLRDRPKAAPTPAGASADESKTSVANVSEKPDNADEGTQPSEATT